MFYLNPLPHMKNIAILKKLVIGVNSSGLLNLRLVINVFGKIVKPVNVMRYLQIEKPRHLESKSWISMLLQLKAGRELRHRKLLKHEIELSESNEHWNVVVVIDG